MENYIYINDQLLPATEATLNVRDLAIQRGYGLFDFFKTIGNRPIFLDDHLDRFYHSADEMGLEIAFTLNELKGMISTLIAKNNIPDSGIKLILTGGYSDDGFTITGPANLIIQQTPLVIKNLSDSGIKLMSYHYQRQLPSVKSIDYVQAIRLQKQMRESGVGEILYYYNSIVGESPRSNFFIVTNNEILTAENNILKGVIRGKIMGLNIPGYTVAERDFTMDDLFAAKEAFLSSTTRQAHPVVAVDGRPIGDGQPGPVVREINRQLFGLMEKE
ncbi:D-alanine transaminase/branched-chain amino acid aminotransferase [Mucilaginibacter yixingensis]|uniref:branched-chain-amino-acid transaminase n=1 Tax=Mucilaginibacter yixingensis TaxID=1295612 RepID=A0A2T5JCF8_9SPHI|nr:aminotransferase class IV [Mucilaginibacter yixingensis]PTQ99448.1 D-alanine transaminase/branched-chain amino acid aminotransferase [Mucilaginibacter yixingensis]